MSRCNNSSPRICMRNHYALLAHLKISYVFDLQDKHNASYFYPNVMDRAFLSACKITQKHSLQQAIITYCSFLSTALSFNHKFHLSVLPWQDSSTSLAGLQYFLGRTPVLPWQDSSTSLAGLQYFQESTGFK